MMFRDADEGKRRRNGIISKRNSKTIFFRIGSITDFSILFCYIYAIILRLTLILPGPVKWLASKLNLRLYIHCYFFYSSNFM